MQTAAALLLSLDLSNRRYQFWRIGAAASRRPTKNAQTREKKSKERIPARWIVSASGTTLPLEQQVDTGGERRRGWERSERATWTDGSKCREQSGR